MAHATRLSLQSAHARRVRRSLALAAVALWLPAADAVAQTTTAAARVEEIYVARSMRESRTKPGDFCVDTRTGFDRASIEDRFTLRSIATRPEDGLVVDTDVRTIGRIHVCFGATDRPGIVNFYAEGTVATVPFTGIGECHAIKENYPEPGVAMHRCFLDLRGLPPEYIGGHLTANTVISRVAVGPVSDPPGYTQSSIATIRLWRKR